MISHSPVGCQRVKKSWNYQFQYLLKLIKQYFRKGCYGGTLVDRLNAIGRFLDSRFGLYSPNHLCYRKYVLISIKALMSGYFEPKKLRARPPNKADTPL